MTLLADSLVPAQDADAIASGPVLTFECVTLPLTWPYDTVLKDISFTIRPGELILMTLAPGHVRSPFADLAQGLIEPQSGTIHCGGKSWPTFSPPEKAKVRARIGRVFDVGGWVSNLDVDENVLLAQRHHNAAPPETLCQRAEQLARRFGLPAVPVRRPAEASQFELRACQWIRSLLVDMRLLILERPARDVQPASIPPFLDAISTARARGAGVLWITTDGAAVGSLQNVAPPAITRRYAVQDGHLIETMSQTISS